MGKINDFQKFWFLGLAPTLGGLLLLKFCKGVALGNLLEIQFASDYQDFRFQIREHSHSLLTNNQLLDFFFILCYTVLFMLSLKLISLALDFHFKKRAYLFCLVPGLLDVLENTLFLGLIEDCAYFFTAYFWVVRIKWGIAAIFIQLIMAILLFYFMLNGYHGLVKIKNFFSKTGKGAADHTSLL